MSCRLLRYVVTAWTALALSSPAFATDPVFPPGSRVGMELPGALMLSMHFPGFEDTGRKVEDRQVRAGLPDGSTRYYDGLTKTSSGKGGRPDQYQGLEVKTGQTPRDKNQKQFDAKVDSGTPATARLHGKPIEITSTRLLRERND